MTGPSNPPSLSANRAKALLTELLVGFSSKTFQRRLDALVRAQSPRGVLEFWHLEGRKELARTVQCEVLPKYGFEGTDAGVAQMVKAIQPWLGDPKIADLSEAIKQRLRLPCKAQPDSESSDEEVREGQPPKLKREKAIALQSELLVEYSAPAFQTRLRCALRRAPDLACQVRRRLVREVQATVLPRFGFEATDAGVDAMKVAFEPWAADPEVLNLNRAIEEQLTTPVQELSLERTGHSPMASAGAGVAEPTSPAKLPSLLSPPASPSKAAAMPQPQIGRDATVEMLKEMLEAFSTPDFQSKTRLLAQSCQAAAAGRCDAGGCDELALSVQRAILPRYGFPGSRQGVISMMCTCSKYASDPEVVELNDAINEKLGMDMVARTRFRQRLAAIASRAA